MIEGTCETIQVVTKVTAENPAGRVTINKSDLTSEQSVYDPNAQTKSTTKKIESVTDKE